MDSAAVERKRRAGGFWGLVAVAVVSALFVAGPGVGAQPQEGRVPQPRSEGPVFEYVGDPVGGKLNAPSDVKLGSGLSELATSARAAAAAPRAAAWSAKSGAAKTVPDLLAGAAGGVAHGSHMQSVVVVTVRTRPGAVPAVTSHLEALGARVLNTGVDYVEARVRADLLGRVSAHGGVGSVRLTVMARTDPVRPSDAAGSFGGAVVTSAAVEGIGADDWHTAGYDGDGVKVAIISPGYRNFNELRGIEVPSTVTARCYSAVGDLTADFADCVSAHDDDHGTVMTEAVFDIAPGADYYIANPFSFGDLNSVVDWLIEQDVDVVHVSVGYTFDGPGDGTSPYAGSPLNVVDRVVDAGITWVQSAGNEGNKQWVSGYDDANDNDLHDFLRQSDCNGMFISEGSPVMLQLRWDDDWGSADIDLDLYLMDMRGRLLYDENNNKLEFDIENDPILAHSGDVQDGGEYQDPYERIYYVPEYTGISCAVVHLDSGDDEPYWLQLHVFLGSHMLLSSYKEWSLGNPSESINKGMLSVQAAYSCDVEKIWAEIELQHAGWNPRPRVLAPYSSRGHPPGFKWTSLGLEPDWYHDASIINEVISYAGCETRSMGAVDGTSQSSAFVAGMAALVLDRFPDWGPVQVADYIRHNAHPVLLWGKSPNSDYGYGLAQMPADLPVAATNLTATTTDRSVTVSWDVPAQPDIVSISDMYLERLDGSDGVERSVVVDFDVDDSESSSWEHSDYHFVDPGGTYRYRVRLETSGDGDVYSDVLEVTTPSESPSPPEGLAVTATHDTATLAWTVPEQPSWLSEPVSLWVMRERNGGRAAQAGTVQWQRATTGYTFTDTGLYPGQSYRYYIRAYMGSTLHTSAAVPVNTLAAPTDPDAARAGAAALDATAAAERVQYLNRDAQNEGLMLHQGGGDTVDYYTFTTTTRQDVMFEVRTDRIDIDTTLEDAGGDTLAQSVDQSTRHDRIETLTATIDAGTYYIRVEATQDGTAAYRVAFALTEPGAATNAEEPTAGPLAGFSLIDASDQTLIATLTDGATVTLNDPDAGSYAIRADITDGAHAGSVRLQLTGPKTAGPKTESYAPFSLYGDHPNGSDRHLDGEALPQGQYTITATAYSQNNLRGTEQGTLEVSFTVTG